MIDAYITTCYHSDMEKDFYTVNEFAEKLRVHPNSVRKSIKNGRINAIRLGDSKKAMYRIPRSEITRLVVIDIEDLIDKEIKKKQSY